MLDFLNDILWGYVLIYGLIAAGLAFTMASHIYSPELQESSGVALTQTALADHVGEWRRSFVSIALMLFAFSTMIYNYYLGENSLNFFSEENKTLFNGFRVLT